MSTAPVLTGQNIGRTHYAVRALLERRLEPAGLDFERWLALNAVGTNGPVAEAGLIALVTGGLKVSPERARRRVAELLAAGLLTSAGSAEEPVLELSEPGRELWTRVTAEVRPITGYLFEGFTEAEKATVANLLNRVTERADAALTKP
jgi:DNA-binding MarR family transcriptional regulator